MMGIRATFLTAVCLAWGCRGESGSHEHEHGGHEHGGHDHGGHDHGGDGPTVSITRWTEKFELFAEHPAAVVGETVGFVAHLTKLSDFSPVTEGRVVLVLEGPQTIRAEHDRPLRDGIFKPRFIPRTPGTYRARLEITIPGLEDTIDGMTVEVYPSAEVATAAFAETEEESGGISFLKEQQWQVPFGTAFAIRRSVVPTIEVSGEVTTPPSGQAEIGTSVAGRIVAPPEGIPRPGQTVAVGQVLALIAPAPSSPEEGARSVLAVAEAQARLSSAQADLARAERLIRDRAISERELENARREVQVAEQAVASAHQARSLFQGAASGGGAGSYRLTAPIGGILSEVNATTGQTVSDEDVLFRIVDPSELWIRARVPEQDAPGIRSDEDASYSVGSSEGWQPIHVTGTDATASVVSVGRTVSTSTRTVEVIYALRTEEPNLRIGGLVRVAIPIGEGADVVAIPRDSVIDMEGRTIVYVQREGETFEERAVRIGQRSGDIVGVLRGIEPGERVVTRGANFIRLAQRAPAGAGHGHVH